MTHSQPQFLKLFSHPRPPIALQADPMLRANLGQKHHIIPLALAHWTVPPHTTPTRADLPDPAEKLHRPNCFPGIYEGKPHRLWPAKKIAAFFSRSLSSRSSRTSLRRRHFPSGNSHAAQTSDHHVDAAATTCSALRGQPPNPRKAALAEKPLVTAIRTASRRNLSVYFFAIPHLLHSKYCSKETGN